MPTPLHGPAPALDIGDDRLTRAVGRIRDRAGYRRGPLALRQITLIHYSRILGE